MSRPKDALVQPQIDVLRITMNDPYRVKPSFGFEMTVKGQSGINRLKLEMWAQSCAKKYLCILKTILKAVSPMII
jgi:hypothetical protein